MKHLFLTLSLVATLVFGSCSNADAPATEAIDTTAVTASVDTVAIDTTAASAQSDTTASDTGAVSASVIL